MGSSIRRHFRLPESDPNGLPSSRARWTQLCHLACLVQGFVSTIAIPRRPQRTPHRLPYTELERAACPRSAALKQHLRIASTTALRRTQHRAVELDTTTRVGTPVGSGGRLRGHARRASLRENADNLQSRTRPPANPVILRRERNAVPHNYETLLSNAVARSRGSRHSTATAAFNFLNDAYSTLSFASSVPHPPAGTLAISRPRTHSRNHRRHSTWKHGLQHRLQ